MNLSVLVLASGSKGNCILLRNDHNDIIMVDCGLKIKQLCKLLANLHIELEQIKAILVTHEHGDHIRGLVSLLKMKAIPTYMSYGTFKAIESLLFQSANHSFQINFIESNCQFNIIDFNIFPVAVPHDASEPLQFRVHYCNAVFGILTDIGHINEAVKQHYQDCNHLYIECNYDCQMLENSDYHEKLKQRIAGNHGHLSNEQAVAMIDFIQSRQQLSTLLIGHISENNNSIEKINTIVNSNIKSIANYIVFEQFPKLKWLTL